MSGPEILVLTTGGTIDKTYFDGVGRYQFDGSKIPDLIKIARVTRPFHVIDLMRKDSFDLDDTDRSAIIAAVREAKTPHIVITHGTDTMPRTAEVLAAEGVAKTVVLVGSFLPARFADSDAAFNLGMAFATAQMAEPGVYIAMNGAVFRAGEVIKDRALGTFRGVDRASLGSVEHRS
ncbi:MAG: asparaginase domain-containing protein [Caulobacteraceae bacterium]